MQTLKQTLLNYQQSHSALPAFNIDSFEIYQAVENAVTQTNLPCIVQLSKSEDKFIQAERLFMLVKKAQIDGLPIYLNMDHGSDPIRLNHLLSLGFDMVHLDGSATDLTTNITTTRRLVTDAHLQGHLVEAEFNKIELVEYGVSPASFTNPEIAANFISQTDADFLAVSIGNLHGVNANLPEQLDLNLLRAISGNLPPNKFLTLHGGSGIPINQIQQAIGLGIVKININTDLRLRFKESLSAVFTSVNSEKIYDYLNPVISNLTDLVKQKLIDFQNHV